VLGYIGEYPEYGWSGTIKTRRKTVGAGIVPGAWEARPRWPPRCCCDD
jgi:hypothetical protein